MSDTCWPIPEGALTAIQTKRTVSVNIETACPQCGPVRAEQVVSIGGMTFCGDCLADFLASRGIPRVTMVRNEQVLDVQYEGTCGFCGKLRPMTREACPHCGRQPVDATEG